MEIILVRICKRPSGSLYIEHKPNATTDDNYIAISHVWGTPDTVQKHNVDGIAWEVSLSPEKADILSILQRDDICGNSWFWMDLFCIDQEASIPKQLEAIPRIYKRSACVKVLMESPVCQEWHKIAISAFDRGAVDPEVFQEEELAHGRKCPLMMFSDLWFERLWTRQEGLYATVLDIVALKPVPCQRQSSDPVKAWISQGTLLSNRFKAESFLLDKLAYHGVERSEAHKALFSIYFDIIYRRRLNIMSYNCDPGPDANYNPIMEAWRSRRCTTKPRDYILAVFPDVDGYKVPSLARKMSFPELLSDALKQPMVCEKFQVVPKVPKGLVYNTVFGSESCLPFLINNPSNIGDAYDTFATNTTPSGTQDKNFTIPGTISLEDIEATESGLETLKQGWEESADINKHVELLSPSGPCIGTMRSDSGDKPGSSYQRFAEEFMSIAVSKYLPPEKMAELELRTTDVGLLQRRTNTTVEDSGKELNRFIVCMICGVSLHTADIVLQAADITLVSTPWGSLLGILNKETKLTAGKDELVLVCNSRWDLTGFLIGLRVNGGIVVRGRTVIPNSTVWDSITRTVTN